MSVNPNIQVLDNAVDRNGGFVWNRLHSEREDICEALLKGSRPGLENPVQTKGMSKEQATRTANWHRELLQSRLRKIDDALDRLRAGSFGNCSKCGRWIEDTKVAFDPAIAFCIDCWQRVQGQASTERSTCAKSSDHMQATPRCALLEDLVDDNPSLDGIALKTLAPFDTICVQTRNSDYRIFLLDPNGRALVEGGRHFVEPVEAMVNGSTFGDSTFKIGWIGIGLRIEFWTNGKLASTSPVQSFHVEHHTSA